MLIFINKIGCFIFNLLFNKDIAHFINKKVLLRMTIRNTHNDR